MIEKIWLAIVCAAMGAVVALAIPFLYLIAARGWYWGSPQEMGLLALFVVCVLCAAWRGALWGNSDE